MRRQVLDKYVYKTLQNTAGWPGCQEIPCIMIRVHFMCIFRGISLSATTCSSDKEDLTPTDVASVSKFGLNTSHGFVADNIPISAVTLTAALLRVKWEREEITSGSCGGGGGGKRGKEVGDLEVI